MLGRRQGAADHRHSEQAGAVHERRAVPPLHPHRAVAEGRDLCLRRLRQCLRAQIHARRQADQKWGEPGTDPGQFNIVHNIVTDADGWVYVADRENHRVQVFDGNGKYETQWNNLHRPCALCCCGGARIRISSSANSAPACPSIARCRISGRASASWTRRENASRGSAARTVPASRPENSWRRTASRWIRRGDIYVGEVGVTDWKTSFPDTPMPAEVAVVRCLQKLEKV